MKTISTLLFTFFVVIAFAQTPYAPFAQVLSPSGSQELFLTSEGNVMCNVWNGHLNEKYAGQFFQIDQDGALLDDFSFEPLSNDNPKRIIELPDGNFFAAGLFYDPVNGDTLPNLLRLLPDGSIDPNFNSDLDLFYNIYSVEVLSSGDIWVAGIRRNHPGATLFEIAVLDADGKMKDFLPLNFTDSAVFGIKEQGPDSILIWGYLYLNGEGFGGIRIDEAGNIDPSFDLKLPSYTAVLDLKLDAFGRIITVGDYFYVHDANGTPQISLQLPNEGRSFSTNGNGDFLITTREGLIVVTNGNGITSIGDFDGSLTATCFLADGSPLVSGDFSNFNGHFQPGLVKLTSLSSNAIALPSFTARIEKPGRVNSFVKGLDNSVWMGGDFLYVNGIKRPNLCKLNLAGEIDPNFDLDSQGEILPIEKLLRLSNGNILAAGHYNKDELQNPSLIHGLTLFNPAGQVLLTGSD
ncbi:MAG: delta-60 repeat domain-containing protein, partial [Saprospiraceae bacterium]|nr:delta-60 repeat domain-containing protein [Saprospiraceae bacterium]